MGHCNAQLLQAQSAQSMFLGWRHVEAGRATITLVLCSHMRSRPGSISRTPSSALWTSGMLWMTPRTDSRADSCSSDEDAPVASLRMLFCRPAMLLIVQCAHEDIQRCVMVATWSMQCNFWLVHSQP